MNEVITNLLLNGPSSLGFYEGSAKEDICSSITGVRAAHWAENEIECLDVIRSRANGYTVLLNSVLLAVLLIQIIRSAPSFICSFLLLLRRPVALSVEDRRAIILDLFSERLRIPLDETETKRLGVPEGSGSCKKF